MHVLVLLVFLCPSVGLALEQFQWSDNLAAFGKRRLRTRWNDHRQVNRTRQGRQRRLPGGDPFTGRDLHFAAGRPYRIAAGSVRCRRASFIRDVRQKR